MSFNKLGKIIGLLLGFGGLISVFTLSIGIILAGINVLFGVIPLDVIVGMVGYSVIYIIFVNLVVILSLLLKLDKDLA